MLNASMYEEITVASAAVAVAVRTSTRGDDEVLNVACLTTSRLRPLNRQTLSRLVLGKTNVAWRPQLCSETQQRQTKAS